MRVRALKEHMNDYGSPRLKAVKAEYEIEDERDARNLIDMGIIEQVKDKK